MMSACPPISHPRSWLCSLPWLACVHVRWVIGKELTLWVSHPNLLCALLIHELRVVVFASLQSLSLLLGNKLLSAKNVRITVKWLQIVALQKVSRRKCDCFFVFVKLPNHWLFGIPRLFNSNYYHGKENQNNSAINQNKFKSSINWKFRCGYCFYVISSF